MSKGNHGGAHRYDGRRVGRAARLFSKLGRRLDLDRLEQLLREASRMVRAARR